MTKLNYLLRPVKYFKFCLFMWKHTAERIRQDAEARACTASVEAPVVVHSLSPRRQVAPGWGNPSRSSFPIPRFRGYKKTIRDPGIFIVSKNCEIYVIIWVFKNIYIWQSDQVSSIHEILQKKSQTSTNIIIIIIDFNSFSLDLKHQSNRLF